MRAAVDTLVRRIDAHARVRFPASSASNELRAHVVAFSGGVDSSLAAALVHQAFPRSAAACLGVSPSLSRQQLSQARAVAAQLQLPLWECATAEGANADYVANRGERCVCECSCNECMQWGRVTRAQLLPLQDDAVRDHWPRGDVCSVSDSCSQCFLLSLSLYVDGEPSGEGKRSDADTVTNQREGERRGDRTSRQADHLQWHER